MGMISKLFGKNKATTTNAASPTTQPTASSIYNFQNGMLSRHDYFDNIYDNAIALAKGFARVEPFMVDNRGRRLTSQQDILDKLTNPLEGVSAYQFRKMLALMTITHDIFYILIHTSNAGDYISNPTENSLAGFEILQSSNVTKAQYDDYYMVNTGTAVISVAERRMMKMTDVLNPFDLTQGYSTMRAVQKWATLDDFIIQYQHGLFMNGAVPQGQFNICATKTDFETIAHTIQATIRNNQTAGVLYNHIPIDSAGKAQTATIEWAPMSSTNKDMATTDLQTNNTKKIDSDFGVPQEIRGYLSNSNYASVRVAELVFEKYSVEDLLMAIWSKFNQELNRCVGGYGKAISYEHELPIIADEEKVKAETQTINIDNIYKIVDHGGTVEAAVEILGLPTRYVKLATMAEEPAQTPDNPEAQGSGEAAATPEAETKVKAAADRAKADDDEPLFTQSDVDLSKYEQNLTEISQSSAQRLVDAAIDAIKPKESTKTTDDDASSEDNTNGEDDETDDNESEELDYEIPVTEDYYDEEEDDKELDEDMMVAIICAVIICGQQYRDEGQAFVANAGVKVTLPAFTAGDQKLTRLVSRYINNPTEALKSEIIITANMSKSELIKYYVADCHNLAKSYNADTVAEINKVFTEATSKGLPLEEVKKKLEAIGLEEWRAKRLADTEIHRVKGKAFEHVGELIEKMTGKELEKMVVHPASDAPCLFCQSYIGRWYKFNEPFCEKGADMVALDGQTRTNNFETITTANFHPNCHCQLVARFADEA